MLQYFTGSKQHNIDLREFALKQDYSLNEYGIKDTKTGELHTCSTEKEFYNFLGLEYIPPEIREGTKEIPYAKKHTLPKLIAEKDIKGDFHMHASYDIKTSHDVGANTYEELVDKAVEKGYSYMGFADHNPRQSGLSQKEVSTIMRDRHEHIHTVLTKKKEAASKEGIHLPKWYIGLEVDILPSGELALPDEAFEYVDYLVVSIHSSFTKKREEQTERLVKALSYPKVRIFGHPTGRLLGRRSGVDADWNSIYTFAAEKGIAMEINSSPKRLDLSDEMAFDACQKGCLFCVNTDAHAADQMDGIKYGITVARRAWLEGKNVVNTWDEEKFDKWILQK
jgi:DNA polymerase (family 10)